MAKKQVNVRLGDDAIRVLKWWVRQDEVSEAEVITRALTVYDEMRASGGVINEADRSPVIKELSGLPTDAPAVRAAVALASSPDSKYLRPNGQPMNYFERQAVDKREHLASVAASDKSGAGRDDIEYEPQS